ncbi:MAG: restriction endonuclease subunit S [Candidatus Tenebribacter mawsonii]|nr:restriction endonuclease subunit S [Candidatus Tenebribacter mawsonii]
MKKSWEYGILDDAVKKGSSNISLNKIKDDEGVYPVFGAKGFAKNVSFFQQEKEYLAIIKDGAGIGRVSKHPQKSSVLATMQYLIPKEGFDIGFVEYFLNSIDFKKHRNGSTIPHIYFKDYKSELFPILPLPEQKRIVSILDQAFAVIDKAIANTENNLQNTKELFDSYLNEIFSNPGNDWEEKKLGEVCDVRDGTHDSPKYQESGFPLITSKNLKREGLNFDKIKYISEVDFNKINLRSKVDKGDILLAMIGTIGNPIIVDIDPNFAIKNVALIKIPETLNNSFLKYYLESDLVISKMQNESKGTTQKFVGLGYLRTFPIIYPMLNAQNKIVEKLDSLSAETKHLESIYKQKLDNLKELKQSILQKAFKGEL